MIRCTEPYCDEGATHYTQAQGGPRVAYCRQHAPAGALPMLSNDAKFQQILSGNMHRELTALADSLVRVRERLADVQASNDHWARKYLELFSLLERSGFTVDADHRWLTRAGKRYYPEEER